VSTESFATTPGGLSQGAVIDKRYQVIELIAEGGMGQVYRAEHIKLRRPVAVKLLHKRVAGLGNFGKRFEREAVAAARLDHPNVVGVSDFGELDDGTHYLVMELVDGQSVLDLLDREEKVPLARALHIGVHVLRGLQYAHENGVIHRDVKPANIVLVDRDGDQDFARVVDFGIAKLTDGDGADKLTGTGDVFGSPTYMAPEQALGNNVDHRADVYAAAVVVYELISGVPPFWGDDKLQVLARKTSTDPPPFREVCQVPVPAELEAALLRALARNPDERVATAGELCAILEWQLEALTGAKPRPSTPLPLVMPEHTPAPVLLPRPSAETPVPGIPEDRPRRLGMWLAIGIGATLMFALILGILASRGDPDAFGEAPGEQEPAAPAPPPKTKPPAKPDGKKPEPKPVVAPPPADPPATSPQTDAALEAALKVLQKGRRCKDRKLAVEQLRVLGDKRAIPPLTKARRRMAGGILGIGQENINACLTKDADAAIAYLRSLP
jgi:eukaryotic-like serine/threonine-protein kinase